MQCQKCGAELNEENICCEGGDSCKDCKSCDSGCKCEGDDCKDECDCGCK